ncbi:MAG: GAF domain-containing protein [Candidatus Eisenbacteria bacterium]|uniref:GAF domain-containing protein n=1 Tax=Eiseniibacteriota bacterium TaxID=2212470 RepID=A0A9D6L4K8_UNCEI|nr:GAF domain-containing protein [Candidatus Eisenbacteria bacterium]MBI3538738.1 GAF domain-containing protein [Candidatus Eisenbacteria bacterium]
MSKFDLRDISQRLSSSRDTEGVVFEFLGYLQATHADWHASLAFYEVSRDALVSLYERNGSKLVRRDVSVPVDRLPARLVRKFFHPSAFFNAPNRRSLLAQLFQASPFYEPDATEGPALQTLTGTPRWESCVCLPLADREDILALLVLVSPKKNAFGARVVGDLIPVKSMAALALAQHLYRNARPRAEAEDGRAMADAASDFHDRIRRLDSRTAELTDENRVKADRLHALTAEIEQLDQSSSAYKQELTRVKGQLHALEEQSAAASEHLTIAYSQLTETQERMTELQRTVGFLKDVFQVLAEEHDGRDFTATMVAWFSEHFGVERCSLMVLDPGRDTLRIAAHRGLDPAIAGKVKVRLGQGISGWVAQTRKPLFVRVRSDADGVQHTDQDAYNSDSFICVPLIHRDRLAGVLNLSNKKNGVAFDELDLDRAQLAGSLLAMSLGAHEQAKRSAAWS